MKEKIALLSENLLTTTLFIIFVIVCVPIVLGLIVLVVCLVWNINIGLISLFIKPISDIVKICCLILSLIEAIILIDFVTDEKK